MQIAHFTLHIAQITTEQKVNECETEKDEN